MAARCTADAANINTYPFTAFTKNLTATYASAKVVQGKTNLLERSIWLHEVIPVLSQSNHRRFLQQLSKDAKWSFWHDWYKAMWNGTFDDWELAFEVIKIADDTWEGEGAGAEAIIAIKARLIKEAAGLNETLVVDEETHQFSIEPVELSDEDVLRLALERAEDALDDVFALGRGNGLTQNTVEARILLRLFRKYRNDAERVAFDFDFDFVEVTQSIKRQIESGEYPEDPQLTVLTSNLRIGVDEICVRAPQIKEALERNYKNSVPKPQTEADVLLLTDAMLVLPEMMVPPLWEQIDEDIAEVLYGVVMEADTDLATPDNRVLPEPRLRPYERFAAVTYEGPQCLLDGLESLMEETNGKDSLRRFRCPRGYNRGRPRK